MADTPLWNLDPVFAVSVGTMWREVEAQLQRFVDQNGQSDAPNDMLCGWIDMVKSAKRIQALVLQGGVANNSEESGTTYDPNCDVDFDEAARSSTLRSHTGMLQCVIEGERQAIARKHMWRTFC